MKEKKPWWRRALKVVGIAIAVIAVLILVAVSSVIWVLTPERLTPMATGIATEYLDAQVKADKIELTFWKSFPHLKVDVDGLTIISHAFDSISSEERAKLPEYADTLLRIKTFSGGINVMKLALGEISVYDVQIGNPEANIVVLNDSTSNYDIVPPSEESEAAGEIPKISINRFYVTGGFPVRYVSVADSINFRVLLRETDLEGENAPQYKVEVDGAGGGRISDMKIPDLTFGINGGVKWDPATPYNVTFNNFSVGAGGVSAVFDADLALSDTLTLNTLEVRAKEVNINDVVQLIPEDMRGELSKLDAQFAADINLHLLRPYAPQSGGVPSAEVNLKVPGGTLTYDRLRLENFAADVTARIDGDDLNRSVVDLRNLALRGRAIDMTLSGTATNLMTDPKVKGVFRGLANFNQLPKKLVDQLPFTVTGQLKGTATINTRLSYLTPKDFHKMRLDGTLSLTDFRMAMRDSSMIAYTRRADFDLGTSSKVTIKGYQADSMLKAKLTIDTICFADTTVRMEARGVKMAVGMKNTSSSTDSSIVNPIGANIRAERLHLVSTTDSMRVRLRDAAVNASLTRFKSNARSPYLRAGVEAKRIMYADRYNRAMISDGEMTLKMHMKGKRPMPPAMKATYDSIAAAHPELKADSLYALTVKKMSRRRGNRPQMGQRDGETMDFGVDNTLKAKLRQWHAEGTLKAKRARLFTPFFPLRNRVENVDVAFSTDSVKIHDLRLQMGKSDFLINGSINDISRALTSRRRTPLKLALDVQADTVDVNEITKSLMAGQKFADKVARHEVSIVDTEDETKLQKSVESQVDTTEKAAVIIPLNLEAELKVRAKHLCYADIWFNRFVGKVSIRDGAMSLQRLAAFTPMGSLDLTALYVAPNKENLRFAAGMVVRKLDLHQFLHMIPQIDSIMPLLKDVEGIITTEIAMTTDLDSMMNLKFHTLDMAMKLSGDSLVLLDNKTFKTVSKWLLFKHKNRNMIDHMNVEMMIRDSRLDLFPFVFEMDRYKLGISGFNDASLNLDYHIAVLKSPIPFKFGVNITGRPDHLKIRLGKARFNENAVASSRQLTDTVRINLLHEIEQMFKFGVKEGHRTRLAMSEPKMTPADYAVGDTLSRADSTFFIEQGVIERPEGWIMPGDENADKDKKSKKRKRK